MEKMSMKYREGAHLSEMLTCAALAGPAQVPLKLQILHQGQPLRELQANSSAQVREGLNLAAACPGLWLFVAHHVPLCSQEPGFAEVLPSLTDQEMDWLVLGELQMVLERAGGPELRISGYITTRRSCDGEAGWGLASWARTTQRHKCVLKERPK